MEIAKYTLLIWILPIAIAVAVWIASHNISKAWLKAIIRASSIIVVLPLPVQLPLGGTPTAILPGYMSWIGVMYFVPAILVSIFLWLILFVIMWLIYMQNEEGTV